MNFTKYTLSCLLVAFSCVSVSAQTKVKTKLWTDQLKGSWQIDSMIDLSEGRNKLSSSEVPKLMFLADQKLILTDNGKFTIGNYDLLQGIKNRYISLSGTLIRVDAITDKTISCSVTSPDSEEPRMLIYFSRTTFPVDTFKNTLAGTYLEEQIGDAIWDGNEAIASPYFMKLGLQGDMTNHIGKYKDSGSWSFDANTLTLELKGKTTTRFKLADYQQQYLKLVKVGAPNDSFIILIRGGIETEQEEEFMIEDYPVDVKTYDVNDPFSDSLRRADSLAAVQEMEEMQKQIEQQMEEEYRKGLYKEWKAVSTSPEGTDVSNKNIRLELKADGTLIYHEGRKEYKGSWRKGSEFNALVFNFKGKEQLVSFNLTQPNEYNPGAVAELTLTFIPPGEKTVKTYLFK